jgi:pullulanase/glycogen debranching enzyme
VNRDTDLVAFSQRLFAFRAAHPELRPTTWESKPTWLDGYAATATNAYLGDATKSVLAWRTGELYVAYNRGTAQVSVTLPAAPAGKAWYRATDTSSNLEPNNFAVAGSEYRMQGSSYGLPARALAIFFTR